MYEYLQQPIIHKKFISIPRSYPSLTQITSNIQPWHKQTLQIVSQEQPLRQVRTFYSSQKKNQQQKHYMTARGNKFREQRPKQTLRKTNSLLTTERKSALTQYNINGNILGQSAHSLHYPLFHPSEPPSLPFRTTIHRNKSANTKFNDLEQTKLKGYASLMQMRRKMTLQKQRQRQDEGYVHLFGEFDDVGCQGGNRVRKGKMISLGYQKLCWGKSKKQSSSHSKYS